MICSTCGAALARVRVLAEDKQFDNRTQDYNHNYGETDLAEAAIRWRGGTYLLGSLLILGIVSCVGILFVMGSRLNQGTTSPGITTITPIPTQADSNSMTTNTPRPTLNLPTVTPAPPTISPSPTPTETALPTPCMQEVHEGDDLFALVSRCGHQHYEAIILEVVEINGLTDPSRIQIGQVLEIPWPTPTPDPNAVVTEEVTSNGALEDTISIEEDASGNPEDESIGLSPEPTETLQPGVTWHRVVKDENIIVIAVQYGVNVEILSQLNPEITFSQCDFSLDTGGPNCIVQIFEGQLIRVPAPTPTPSLSPTPSGSETPTPTATPTFNAPSALSPGNRESFQVDEFVTLRWVASGTLAPGQAYRVDVIDQTTGSVFSANTQELFFIVPEGWQGQDSEDHTYSWTVSIINTSDPNNPFYITEARIFIWQGRGESSS